MKVVCHEDFYQVYSHDPAAAEGRMESIVRVIAPRVEFVTAEPATEADLAAVHTEAHLANVRNRGLYSIAALAAGAAIQAAEIGLSQPGFGLVRPPGHHASAGSSWGFCYFNNMAIALEALRREKKITTAYVLDIDAHFGDGTVNIFGGKDYVKVHNVLAHDRQEFLAEVAEEMSNCQVDLIGVSAGFDNHKDDWIGLLETEDYHEIGRKVRAAAARNGGGCFGLLEGGYNHDILGHNVMAFLEGLSHLEA